MLAEGRHARHLEAVGDDPMNLLVGPFGGGFGKVRWLRSHPSRPFGRLLTRPTMAVGAAFGVVSCALGKQVLGSVFGQVSPPGRHGPRSAQGGVERPPDRSVMAIRGSAADRKSTSLNSTHRCPPTM